MDDAFSAEMDRLRKAHFPDGLNRLRAHLTLFHHLPGEEFDSITATLAKARDTAAAPIEAPRLRFLGRGVAVEVESASLLRVHQGLADTWRPWLTPQDRQKFRPHVTIQNKVDPSAARGLFEGLAAGWMPLAGQGTALELWWYDHGNWLPAGAFAFNEVPSHDRRPRDDFG